MASASARGIVGSIVGLARSLELDCIVEGVESPDEVVLPRGLGCRLMQGYLFHNPMPAEAVASCLRRQEADEPGVQSSAALSSATGPSRAA